MANTRGLTQDNKFFRLEQYQGLNTKASRAGIGDQQFYWLENFIPLGPNNLRTLYGPDTALYTPSGVTIDYFYEYNIGVTAYSFVALSNGSAVQVRKSDGAVTTIAPSSTFSAPACAQWGNQYLLIIDTTGYFIWDGALFYEATSIAPESLTITNGGQGYTSAPTVNFAGGGGSGAAATASISQGSVTGITLTNAGHGYTSVPTISLVGGYAAGSVSSIAVTAGGSGYTTAPTVTFTGSSTTTATATAVIGAGTQVASVTMSAVGSGYTNGASVAFSGGGGSGAAGTMNTYSGVVVGVTITNPGSGYTSAPTVDFSAGGGTGAAGTAVLTSGAVLSITVNNPGAGYATAPTIGFSGGGGSGAAATATLSTPAQATCTLMPSGVKGTDIETYLGRVWIVNSNELILSSPASVSDFATSDGGGVAVSQDSFLRVAWYGVKQSAGFLYLFGDSSVNVISNVQTQGSPPTTTFNNVNTDPQVGTSWPNTIVAFGRALVYANPTGVYALYGGTATKISDDLDGIFENLDSTFTPSASLAVIYGVKVYVILLKATDPFGVTRPVMYCYDGKVWFAASQATNGLSFIANQQFTSSEYTWATDGTSLFKCFATASSTLQKQFYSKLWEGASFILIKQALRVGVFSKDTVASAEPYTINIDSDERTVSNVLSATPVLLWFNNSGNPITWTNSSGATITWLTNGYVFSPSTVDAGGNFLGLSGSTYAPDRTIIGAVLQYNERTAW